MFTTIYFVLIDVSEKSEAISVEDISYGQEVYKLLSFFIAMITSLLLLLILINNIFRESGRDGVETEREKRCGRNTLIGCLAQAYALDRELDPREIIWCVDQFSNHWETLARAVFFSRHTHIFT